MRLESTHMAEDNYTVIAALSFGYWSSMGSDDLTNRVEVGHESAGLHCREG